MGARKLIVTADDFNLTPGVSRGILEAIAVGSVRATSVMMNLPWTTACAGLRRRRDVSVGVHIVLTYGKPVLAPNRVPSLIDSQGCFYRRSERTSAAIVPAEVEREIAAQIELFQKKFRRKPAHIDSHHHVHADKSLYPVFAAVAREFGVPLRRRFVSRLTALERRVLTTDQLLIHYDPQVPWNTKLLGAAISKLRPGVSELVVHPGYCDAELIRVSRFNYGRDKERLALCDRAFKELCMQTAVDLCSFEQANLNKMMNMG